MPLKVNAMAHPLDGIWWNELGSKMKLVTNPDGSLEGWYQSAVGVESQFVLVGRFDTNPHPDEGRSLGWTVTWRNAPDRNKHSTTTWSAQYFDSPPRILSQWLLTRSTKTQDVWESTIVGRDVFHRHTPTAESKLKAHQYNAGSHFPPVDEDENDGPETLNTATSDTN